MSQHPAPPTPTLLLLNLPPSILCSIDLLTFTTSPTFLGIKNLPAGYHFVFTSHSQSLSLRDGFWFYIPPSTPCPTLYRKWNSEHEHLTDCSEAEGRAAVNERGGAQLVYEKFLTPYRQSAGTTSQDGEAADSSKEGAWEHLTKHITSKLLDRFTRAPAALPGSTAGQAPITTLVHNSNGSSSSQGPAAAWTISSASSGLQDRDEIPGLSTQEARSVIGEEQELGMLGIDLKKTWRDGAVGRERTEQARDRSWLLASICHSQNPDSTSGADGWEEVVLGQMEICFLMILTLANYSCLEEWKRILALVMTCENAVGERPAFFAAFLRLLKRQLERVDDVEGGLFEMSEDGGGTFLKRLLQGFKRILDRYDEREGVDEVKEEFAEVEKWVREQFGWELGDEFVRSGMLELEDGEMVEMESGEMEGEDESGEYAPVVVEL